MASDRQIAANRRNAARSTGPRTTTGKLRSRQNTYRHGLTAETVITSLEQVGDYQAFEAALFEDYAPHGAVEHELVARLASLLWRLRRAARIETGLLEVQGGALQQQVRDQRAHEAGNPSLNAFYNLLHGRPPEVSGSFLAGPEDQSVPMRARQDDERWQKIDIATVYLRISRNNPDVMKHLMRYETALWRQVAQTLLMLDSAGTSWRRITKMGAN
jgi:hypothetical protein